MLGAAHLLKAREADLPGTVRLFFQPAEETFNGARHLIDAGALDNVAAVFGLHNAPELPTGTFATRAGPFYANVDRFQILITGKARTPPNRNRASTPSSPPARSSAPCRRCPAAASARWNRWW